MNNYIPNTSAIPNILFDYWMNVLTPAEFKVLMCIARKTYGWHKDCDLISLKQIEKMTGLHKSGIIKNIDKLMEVGLLHKFKSKTSDGDDAPNKYGINVYCVEGGSLQNRLPVVDSVDKGVVDSVDTQKKTYTKENIQRTTPPIPPLLEKKNASEDAEKRIDFSPPAEVKQTADEMVVALKAGKETYKVPKSLSQWHVSIDHMIRLDGRSPKQIIAVFRWAIADNFWSAHMFKPNPAKYLREKFDQLEMKMNTKPPKKERTFAPCSDDEEAFRTMQKMNETAL